MQRETHHSKLFSGLNPEQHKAVETVAGKILILAGAGSGKTKVLTLRMAHLIQNLHVNPKSILGLTFTNKAASEMSHRLGGLIDPSSAKLVTISTFHSFCMHILRAEIENLGYTSNFTLYDEKDVTRLMTVIARDLLEHEGDLPSLTPTTEKIIYAKNRGLSSEELKGPAPKWHDEFAATVHKRLQDSMRACNAVDFDSLLCLTVELFERFPDVLAKYQNRYRYIMIDEYQDTNPIQYRLTTLLAAKYQNLCVVGDDDQSIYGWRGADVQNILGFNDAITIKLEQNYRSTNTILKAANAVIGNNKTRHGKSLWSAKTEGHLIDVFHAPTEANEAEAVIFRMDNLRKNNQLNWGDMAILYRSNALSKPFEQALLKHMWQENSQFIRGIPYQIFGGTEFYERREIKDLMAYLRVIVNPLDEEALLRIINYPRRGIGDAALDYLTAYNRKKSVSLWSDLQADESQNTIGQELSKNLSSKAINGIKEFLNVTEKAKEKFRQPALNETLKWLIDELKIEKAIFEEVKSDQMRSFKWDNVQEFIKNLESYEQQTHPQPSLHGFVLSQPLSKGWDLDTKDAEPNKVTLMTIHSAKGLEFPACFLVGMEDHIIPHEKSMQETGVEEERRLMYVALTRAKKFLTLSMAHQRKRMGVEMASTPSRFLLEIPKECLRPSLWHELPLS